MKKTSLFIAMLTLSAIVHADGVYVKPLFQIGYTGGGDQMVNYQYTDGTSSSINAGEGLEIGGGILIGSSDAPFTGAITVNYHFTQTDSNADYTASFNRIPLEFMGYYNPTKHFRIGAGLRYELSAQLDDGIGDTINYNNSVGGMIEMGFMLSKHSTLSLRYVSEQYKPNDTSVHYDQNNNAYVYQTMDGSQLGLFWQYAF